MKQHHTFFAAVVTCLCLFAASAAASTSLPDPWYYGGLGNNYLDSATINAPGSYSIPYISASVAAYPNAAMSTSSSCTAGTNNCTASGNIWITYYFAVTGGNFGDPVTVDVDSLLQGAISGNATGANAVEDMSAAIAVTNDTNLITLGHSIQATCVDACSSHPSWRGTLFLAMTSGDTGTVTMLITADTQEIASGGLYGSGSAFSYADPYIYVDPDTPNAGLYRIVVSSGIGNNPLGSTPEPSSLMLLGSGVTGLAGVLRRKLSR